MKIGIAYSRRLRFEDVSRAEAERVFNTPQEKRSLLDVTAYQDFIVHEGIKRCGEHNIRSQFHTGHLAGPGAYIDNSNPIYLANLFLQYPETRFDLFHGGYPFCGQLGTLAKNFANVHLNTCWMPSVTLSGSKYWLREWIETVPNNKILWGDDSQTIESCAAAVILGKKVVGETLAEMVDDNYFGIETAIDIAERILRRNALEFYDFKKEY